MLISLIFITFVLSLFYTRLTNRLPRGILGCGLFGYSGKRSVNVYKMKMGLWDNESRGTDSTGVYGTQLYRTTDMASVAIMDKAFDRAITGAKEVIGHTRAGTSGAISIANAHPFRIGDKERPLYGTHNGWLFETLINQLAESFDIKTVPEVDSELIYQILYKTKMDYDVLGRIEATMALAFIYDKYLHLYRRGDRPLFYGEADGGIYYSSLRSSLILAGVKDVMELQPYTVHKIQRGELVNAFEIKKPKVILPLDTKRTSWRSIASVEQCKHIPITDPTLPAPVKPLPGGFTFDKRRLPSNHTLPQTEPTLEESFQALPSWLDIIAEEAVNGGTELTCELKQVSLGTTGDPSLSILLVTHLDKINLSPLPGFLLYLVAEDDNKRVPKDVWGFTGITGTVALPVLENSFGQNVRIIAVNPYDTATFYTKPIRLKAGRVREVTLSTSFQRQEEVETKDDNNRAPGVQDLSTAVGGKNSNGTSVMVVNRIQKEEPQGVDVKDNKSGDISGGGNTGSSGTSLEQCPIRDGRSVPKSSGCNTILEQTAKASEWEKLGYSEFRYYQIDFSNFILDHSIKNKENDLPKWVYRTDLHMLNQEQNDLDWDIMDEDEWQLRINFRDFTLRNAEKSVIEDAVVLDESPAQCDNGDLVSAEKEAEYSEEYNEEVRQADKIENDIANLRAAKSSIKDCLTKLQSATAAMEANYVELGAQIGTMQITLVEEALTESTHLLYQYSSELEVDIGWLREKHPFKESV